MIPGLKLFLRRFQREESGQMLPLVALMLTAVLAITGTVFDVGHCYFSYRHLQNSTNAAALAGAASLSCPATSVCSANAGTNAAIAYSSVSGNANASKDLLNAVMISGYPAQKCLNTLKAQGMPCMAPTYANAVQVKQTVPLPLYFWAILGKKTLTLTTSATASMRGASPTPYNVAVLLDESLSMSAIDANCGGVTQIACALNGTQILMKALDPCAKNITTCIVANGVSQNSVDRVAVFSFPAVSTSTVQNYYNCSSSQPLATPYVFPNPNATSYTPVGSTYQVTPFMSDYKTSYNASSLNTSSALTVLAGGRSGCAGMTPPNPSSGYFGTYYAATIYAAQSALLAQQAANPGSQNVMIILSDGDATAPASNNGLIQVMQTTNDCGWGNGYLGVYSYWCGLGFGKTTGYLATGNGKYPSYVGECGQAVTAAAAATGAGTRVYSVAYGSGPVGCLTDVNAGSSPNISPCQTMANMASAQQYFYSDYQKTGSLSTCYSTLQTVTQLSDIFTQIANDLTTARLIPDSTT